MIKLDFEMSEIQRISEHAQKPKVFDKLNGLLPVIIQDYKTSKVLMLGFMNREAWQRTLKTGKATYYSRTRKAIWRKGETSGPPASGCGPGNPSRESGGNEAFSWLHLQSFFQT